MLASLREVRVLGLVLFRLEHAASRERGSTGFVWQNQQVPPAIEPRCLVAVDESKRPNQPYTMVAAFIDPDQAAGLRKALRGQVRRGNRSLHFTKERDHTRKAVLATLVEFGVVADVVQAERRGKGPHPRAVCVRLIAERALAASAQFVVLDRDEDFEHHDKQVLFEVLRGAEVNYQHKARHEDELPWVADAIAWSFAKGGAWRATVAPLIRDTLAG
jgi:macrodomain Ter protein organizer (MatP/YcbG family)